MTVIIVGQVRNEHVLMMSVQALAQCRAAGLVRRVILATWQGELAKMAHLLPRLGAAGVEVTTAAEPDPAWFVPGHMMNQMRGIDLALESVEHTDWVLRTRPDIIVTVDMIASLAMADMSLENPAIDTALSHKIWVPFVELMLPMCICDLTFFGQYSDIARLQNFDMFAEIAGTHLFVPQGGRTLMSYDAEVRRYTPAFMHAYPVLEEYYRFHNLLFLGILPLRMAMLPVLFTEPLYWEYMAVYFDIMRRYLLIGRDILTSSFWFMRPAEFSQTAILGVDSMRPAAQKQLETDIAAALAPDHCGSAPIYCSRSREVEAACAFLVQSGHDLPGHLERAGGYRKDAERIRARQDFRDRAMRTLSGGFAGNCEPGPGWRSPFEMAVIQF